jgi:predicted phosphodiesterase
LGKIVKKQKGLRKVIIILHWESFPQYELELSNLYDEYGSNYYKIVEEMNKKFGEMFSYDSIRNRIRRSPVIDYIPNKRGKGLFAGLSDNDIYNDFVDSKVIVKEIIDFFENKYIDKTINILVISDLHIPKENLDVLEEIILKNQDCNVLVIAGDLLDFDNLSRFGHKKSIDVSTEYKRAFNILKRITSLFEHIFISHGNHEERWASYIKNKNITALSSFLLNKLRPLDPVVEYFDNVHYIPFWFFQLGEVLFVHPSMYSRIEGRTVENCIKNRIEKQHEKKFGKFSTVICGHTHRIFKGEFFGKIAVENGCIQQKNMEFNNKDAVGKNWHHGYTRIKMVNGKTNWNDINVIRVG